MIEDSVTEYTTFMRRIVAGQEMTLSHNKILNLDTVQDSRFCNKKYSWKENLHLDTVSDLGFSLYDP